MNKVVFIDMGHSSVTPGKCSPDKTFREWDFTHRLGRAIIWKLNELGVDARPTTSTEEDDVEVSLTTRANRANTIAKQIGSSNVLFVSIHSNAAGDGKWMKARGWSVYIAKSCSSATKKLANCLFDAAVDHGFKTRKPSPNQKYWTENFTVLTKTCCPAVLTESLFYDNKEDLAILKSEEGFDRLLQMHVDGIMKFLQG